MRLTLTFLVILIAAPCFAQDPSKVTPAIVAGAINEAREEFRLNHKGVAGGALEKYDLFSYVGRDCRQQGWRRVLPTTIHSKLAEQAERENGCFGDLRVRDAVDPIGRKNNCKDKIYISENCLIQPNRKSCSRNFTYTELDKNNQLCKRESVIQAARIRSDRAR